MNVLNVTTLIRHDFIDEKRNENTVLFDLDSEFIRSKVDVNFGYLYIHQYSNDLLGLLNRKWKQYSSLARKKSFVTLGYEVYSLPLFIQPFKSRLNRFLFALSILLYRKRIDKAIKEFQPTIIQAQDVDQSAYVARYIARKYGIPYILVPRGIHQKRFEYINKNIYESAAIVCHGYSQFKPIADEFSSKHSVLIPHGVDGRFFASNGPIVPQFDRLRIVSIGRLMKGKNFDVLIKVVAKFESIELDIYGDGKERDYLSTLIKELNLEQRVNLITAPFRNENLPIIFKKYNLFALVSYPETFGRVFAEAIVCGLPIIGAKRAGLYGQLEEGRNGLFVDPRDERSLEKVFETIIANPKLLQDMIVNNMKIREKYSYNNIIKQYMELYWTLCNN